MIEENTQASREGLNAQACAVAPCLLAALLFFVSFFALFTPAYANDSNKLNDSNNPGELNTAPKTVRIGYFAEDPKFQDGLSDEDGKSGYAYEYYQELVPFAGWVYEYAYGTKDEMLAKLAQGEIDIVAGISAEENAHNDYLLSAQDMGLEDRQLYFAINSNRPDLLEDLDAAMAASFSINPSFTASLWRTYYERAEDIQLLTQDEMDFLTEKKVLRFGYVKLNLPISDVDEEGDVTGLASVLSDSIKSLLGVDVEPVAFENTTLMKSALIDKEIDCAFPLYSTTLVAEERYIKQTKPLVSERPIVAYMGEFRDSLLDRVAMSDTGLGQRYYIEEYSPKSKVLTFASRNECFRAVARGDADCVIGSASVLQHFMRSHKECEKFNIAYLDGSEGFCIGTNVNAPAMGPIMDKVLLQLDSATINNAMVRYSHVEQPLTLTDIFKRYAIATIIFLAIVFAILVFIFLSWRYQVICFNREQEQTRIAMEDALAIINNANKAKTLFLSNMSHDIRTPMNGIIGMTAIAAANIDNPERVEDCLKKITSSSKHLLALINEILDISKIESGTIELTEETFALSEIIDDLSTINRPQAESRKLNLVIRMLNVQHGLVIGDRARLQQIYTNLLSNAIKYTPEGGSVEVKLIERSSGNPKIGCYDFVVADTGIGISKEYLPHIFEAYSRDGQRTISRIQGTGLGMPIAQSIARMMGGNIAVESKLGEGSEFTATVFLRLPKAEEVSSNNLKEHAGESRSLEEIAENASFAGKRALLAEDNDFNAEIAFEFLGMAGFELERAQHGQEALEMFEAHEPGYYDCIFMDVQMPVMDGIEATKRIRSSQHENAQSIPIFAMTANAFVDDIEATSNAGMNEHFVKPIDIDLIVATIGSYFE